jgi:hypothetical protein
MDTYSEIILQEIQGTESLVYTDEELMDLDLILNKTLKFYPKNKNEDEARKKLTRQLFKLQVMLAEYVSAIYKIILSSNKLSLSEIERLHVCFKEIQVLEKQTMDEFRFLILRNRFDLPINQNQSIWIPSTISKAG